LKSVNDLDWLGDVVGICDCQLTLVGSCRSVEAWKNLRVDID